MNIFEWMIAEGYAENSFEVNGIMNGLELMSCAEDVQKSRVIEYRRMRPVRSRRENGIKYYDSKTAFGLVLRGIRFEDIMYCGHLKSDVVQDEGTAFCGACADAARAEDYKQGVAI